MRARQKQVKGQQQLSFACAAPKKAKAQAVALQEPRRCFSHATWLYHFFPQVLPCQLFALVGLLELDVSIWFLRCMWGTCQSWRLRKSERGTSLRKTSPRSDVAAT